MNGLKVWGSHVHYCCSIGGKVFSCSSTFLVYCYSMGYPIRSFCYFYRWKTKHLFFKAFLFLSLNLWHILQDLLLRFNPQEPIFSLLYSCPCGQWVFNFCHSPESPLFT